MKRAIVSALVVGVAIAAACTPSGFDPSTKLESVRVLATRADGDAAYATPGQAVTLDVLAVDARETKPAPLVTYWIPLVCQDPPNDSYVGCFSSAALGDAGAGGGGGGAAALLTPGQDVTDLLPTGQRYTFTVPATIPIKPVNGAPRPYGLVFIFNVACAGRVRIKPIDPSTGPQQVPLGCFDSSGDELPPDDYVIGFTRVYVFDPPLPNANPDVAGIVVNGVETATGGVVDRLPAPLDLALPACHHQCDVTKLDLDVPASSWEMNPNNKDSDGNVRHEAIWVDWYATDGSIDGDARLLYDASLGRLPSTEIKLTPPDDPTDFTLYAVAHDDRDGVTWLQVNVHAR